MYNTLLLMSSRTPKTLSTDPRLRTYALENQNCLFIVANEGKPEFEKMFMILALGGCREDPSSASFQALTSLGEFEASGC